MGVGVLRGGGTRRRSTNNNQTTRLLFSSYCEGCEFTKRRVATRITRTFALEWLTGLSGCLDNAWINNALLVHVEENHLHLSSSSSTHSLTDFHHPRVSVWKLRAASGRVSWPAVRLLLAKSLTGCFRSYIPRQTAIDEIGRAHV